MTSLTSKERVLAIVAEAWRPNLASERIPVVSALSRIPVGDQFSVNDLPVVRSAVMDGWAVKSALVEYPGPEGAGLVRAGDYARADMGDDFDDRFDAVVLVEDADERDGALRLRPGLKVPPGLNVRAAGAQLAKGERLAKAGRPLLPKDLALLQMGGLAEIEVVKKPLVAFIPTGAELIAPGPPPVRGQNIDTNSLLVAETLKILGAEVWNLPALPDDPSLIGEALDKALARADIVILNGGSSKGGEDHVGGLMASRGRTLVRGVAAAPGKPMGIFLIGNVLAVNLPGPMIAAYHGVEWCIGPIIAMARGLPAPARTKVKAVLSEPVDAPDTMSFLVNIELTRAPDGSWSAKPLDPRKARTCEGVAANAQLLTDPARGALAAGDLVEVEVLRLETLWA